MDKRNKYDSYTKDELIDELETLKKKKYGLVWDRKNSQEILDAFVNWENVPENFVPKQFPVLKEIKNKEIESDKVKPVNLLIEGDNYHSLAVLNFTHQNKIDVIYIDPPYNTGKQDFKYNDKFVDEDDDFRHSKWLSFMEKRLILAKNLLKKDGLIFISIDDNEYAQLKMLCDEIFEEQNRLSTHHIQVRYGNKSLNEKKDFQELIEYTLIYAKDKNQFKANKIAEEYDLNKFDLEIKELRKPDKSLEINGKKVDIFLANSYSITRKEKGNIDLFKETWLSGSIYSGTGHGKTYQKIVENRVDTDGLSTLYKIYGLGEDGLGFRYMINPQKTSSSRGKMFTKVPLEKREALENGGDSQIYRPIINYYDFSADFGNIRQEGGVGFNSGKKPVKMLKQFINYHGNKKAIVLDFFAGSGSMGHATLALNAEDDGDRKFILCTNNENNIAQEICYPRLKNVIEGYSNSEGLGGNLKYFKTDFVGSDTNDKNKRDLVKQSTEMICIKEDIFDLVIDERFDFKIYQRGKKFLGVIFDIDSLETFKKAAEKCRGNFVVYCFSYNETTPEKEFKNLNNEYTFKPIPAIILKVYLEIFKK
jgi:adenine-specific DNA-methyltransferase